MSAAVASLSSAAVLQWLRLAAASFRQHQQELTDLDAAIGDADHGANMARGFTAVEGKLPALEGKDIGTVFKTVAMTLISTVGGASGPLYGTFFLQAAPPAMGKSELTPAEALQSLQAGFTALQARGKARLGEKTMIDALDPALKALAAGVAGGDLREALGQAVAAAEKGAEATIPLVASKGRASYLGERSAGHKDPGAASSVLLLASLREALGSGA